MKTVGRTGFRSPEPHRRSSGSPVKAWRPAGGYKPHQGEREKARRRRQMAKGQLTGRGIA